MAEKFRLGQVVCTAAVDTWARAEYSRMGEIRSILYRHAEGDWGEVCPEDHQSNEDALRYGSRLLSVYPVDGRYLWVITEADRSSTTVMFPEDY